MLLTVTAPVREKNRRTTETGGRLTTLKRRINSLAWTEQVFRGLGGMKSLPGRGRGPRLADMHEQK